jgi:hypothetical protein
MEMLVGEQQQDRVALLLDPAGRRSLIRPFRSSQATRLPWTGSSSGRPWMPRGYRSLPTAGSAFRTVADFSERVLESGFKDRLARIRVDRGWR